MEIGHPPGNPTWQLIANVLSHLGGDAHHAAIIINAMSAVAMALASLFLSGIIYLLLRGSLFAGEGKQKKLWANVCAAAGALCYAWCDSAIFSAVEAEVYALSAMFTSLMLWLSLRWAVERKCGNIARSRRLIILIFYLGGLGVGVHELNFLILPAIGLIYWFGVRLYPIPWVEDSTRGRWLLSSGAAMTGAWSILLFCIGACTYFIIPIRATANPLVNTGNPATWEQFKSYYLRDQYGSKPLLYGRTPYSQPLLLERVDSNGNYDYTQYYIKENNKGKKENIYADELNMWLPRMVSGSEADLEFYEAWAGMTKENMLEVKAAQVADSTGRQMGKMNPATGEREMRDTYRPTYWQQMRYMLGYQIGYMYMRYLLWNYSGRQNNISSTGEREHGNFITGIPPIDNAMLGDQKELPYELREGNVGYNRYYMIPFVLGLIGIAALVRAGRRGRRICLIIATFFLFTGLLIVIYLNQSPGEPRERDYSFLGSYMAFAIWIACGMAAIVKLMLQMKFRKIWLTKTMRWAAILFCIAIPLQILSQTWNDHDRSTRRGAEYYAHKYLDDLEPNAIIFSNGDNIIFPIWYAQEVLGIRRDVYMVVIPYLYADWYREQLKRPGEVAPAVAISDSIAIGPGSIKDRAVKSIKELNPTRPIYDWDQESSNFKKVN